MRILTGLIAALAPAGALAANVYAAEVWPSRVTARPDGSYEYLFNLRPAKAGAVSPDVRAEVGEAAAQAFLQGLPAEATVEVDPRGASLSLAAPGEPELAHRTATFAATFAGNLAATSSFDRHKGAAGLPPLHPEVAKLLPSVDMLLWKSRQVEDGILAAVLAASERGTLGLPLGRRAFWGAVLAAAAHSAEVSDGTPRDGALALVARVGAALRASQGSLPASVATSPELIRAIEAEPVSALSAALNPGLIAAYGFTADISNLRNSEDILARPLPDSRAGFAGALAFLALLRGDAKLAKAYGALRDLRNEFLGPAGPEVLDAYQAEARAGADEDLADFLPRVEARTPDYREVRLFAPPRTPIRQFLQSLQGAERGSALDELGAALQDGRVSPDPSGSGSWAVLREAALVPLLKPEESYQGALGVSGSYRARLAGAYRALFQSESDPGQDIAGDAATDESVIAPVLKVRLMVPPHVQVEPLPALYGRLALAYQRLGVALAALPGATGLFGLTPQGTRRPMTARAEAAGLAKVFRGLERMAQKAGGPAAPPSAEGQAEVEAAERFLSGWRGDFDLTRAVAAAGSDDAFSLAVGRRALRVAFDAAPKTSLRGGGAKEGALLADTSVVQEYIIPVLATAPAVRE